MSEPTSVFQVEAPERTGDDERVLPSELAGGPWNPAHQHGAAACALLARSVERVPTPVPMQVQRITMDLMRPLPLEPLRTRTEIVRSGGRTQLVTASILHGETEVARATALSVRTTSGLGLESQPNSLQRTPLDFVPGEGLPPTIRFEHLPGFIRAVDFRRADLEPTGDGPATIWIRQSVPLFGGGEHSPFVQLASAADFASGAANALDFGRYVSINPDVSLHVLRYPESEWIAIQGMTRIDPRGVGQSEATLYDEYGAVGRVQTSLFVDAR